MWFFVQRTQHHLDSGCDKCEKKYDRKYRLEKHKKTAHGDVPELECDNSEVDRSVIDDQPHHPEEMQEAEGDVFNEEADSGNVELDENLVQVDEGMELDDLEAPDVSDPVVKEKLLADRQKLLAELNSLEGQGDLDFLNTEWIGFCQNIFLYTALNTSRN